MDWELHYPTQERLQKFQELYASEQHKIDKTVYSTDELQAYAVYKQTSDTYKDTKDKELDKYSKDLETLQAELDRIAKEINKNIQERSAKEEDEKREQVLPKFKEEIKGIVYDIKRVDKAMEEEDKFINRAEILALDGTLSRSYQHKLARHRSFRKQVEKEKGNSQMLWT